MTRYSLFVTDDAGAASAARTGRLQTEREAFTWQHAGYFTATRREAELKASSAVAFGSHLASRLFTAPAHGCGKILKTYADVSNDPWKRDELGRWYLPEVSSADNP